MGRILLLLACAAVLALHSAAAAGRQTHVSTPGFVVVRNASTDGGVTGKPVATVVVHGFVIGRVAQEGAVEIYHFNSGVGSVAQVSGIDVSRNGVKYRSQAGTKFSGSDFRFRAVGGFWRVVVYGAGVSLYAGGVFSKVSLHGSVAYPHADGRYSLNGGRFASLPSGVVTVKLGKR